MNMTHSHSSTSAWPIRDSHTSRAWLIHMLAMTHSHMGHDSFAHGTKMNHSHKFYNDLFTYGPWLIHICATGHSHLRCIRAWPTRGTHTHARRLGQDPFICGTCLVHMMYAVFTYGTWLISKWDTTHSHLGHDSFIGYMTHSHMGHDSLANEIRLIHIWDIAHSQGRDSLIW